MLRLVRTTNVHHSICLRRQALPYPPTTSDRRYGLTRTNMAGGVNGVSRCRGGHHSCVNVPDRARSDARIVTTIKREKLRAVDHIDVTGRWFPVINTPVGREDAHMEKALHHGGRFARSHISYHGRPFPENSKGFLYFHSEPGRPQLSGELRFRITPSSDPGSFDEGHDLVRQDGFYWRIQLQGMSESLCNLAVRDGLVAPSLLSGCNRPVTRTTSFTPFICYLEQPFFLNFESKQQRLLCTDGEQSRRVLIVNPTRDLRGTWGPYGIVPYRGRAVVRFELSTLPEHVGGNVIVFRVLKLLKPVECVVPNYDGYCVFPEEGSLITTRKSDGVQQPRTIKLCRNDVGTVNLRMFLSGEQDMRPHRSERPVLTLDRNRLQFSDSVRHHYGTAVFHIRLGEGKSVAIRMAPFPSIHPYRPRLNSAGFLYYHKPPDLPDTAGEIRIRLTPTPHPDSWDEGHDLKRPTGDIWGISLFKMLSSTRLEPLATKLIDEGLITPALISHCRMLMGTTIYSSHTNILHRPSQPFLYDFSNVYTVIHIVGRDRIWRYQIPPACVYQGQEQFKGKAWVRFEESQALNNIGKRVIMLRVLDRAELAEAGIEDDNWGADPPYGSTVMRMRGVTTRRTRSTRPWKVFAHKSCLGILWSDM